ncbi:MAG: right-handed parallel beta-helix repeat-containing protein, partial [Planctomycetota bacterium]
MRNLPHHFIGKLTIPLLVFLPIVLMIVLVAPPSYAGSDLTWNRAAYWDGRYPSGWAGGTEVMRDALEFAGYKILDADQLKTWMDARIADGTPSVVVFCQDIAPDTVVESMSSRCTLRRYLVAGGKIVWYADIPMFYQGHSDGTRTGWGNNGSINILGFDAASGPWDTQDEVTFTVNGVNWGLTETWQSERPTSPSGLSVLAEDNRGYAAAWVKHYVPGDNYRGFVRVFDRPGEPNINDVQRVAEYPYVPEPIVYYVDDDATGANDGSSWADAYKCLQDALAAVQYSDVIRVAQGTYKPDQRVMIGRGGLQIINSSGDRTETFQLISGVVIKGGYAGISEPDPDARDIAAYETILSGDLNGDDMPVANPSDLLNEPTRAENSYHVVTGSNTNATAMLDGFTITAGNANGPTAADKRGGGMYNQGGSPMLIRCIFHSNNSMPPLGIGIGADGGGAIYNTGGSLALTQCTFTENNSARDGGGMFNINSRPTVTHCTFSGNSTDISGGGMYNNQSSPAVVNCIFTGNSAQRGGGMRNARNSNPTLANCVFTGNWAETRRRPGDIVGGGAMANKNSRPTLTNCTFSGNSADTRGGGMFNSDNSNPVLSNCIVWGNVVQNSSPIDNDTTSSATITYSDVQGGWPGQGNINADPFFASPGYRIAANARTGGHDVWIAGDYHLKSHAGRWDPDSGTWVQDDMTSPCIDAGDPNSPVAFEPFPNGGIINMGAYGGTAEAGMSFSSLYEKYGGGTGEP